MYSAENGAEACIDDQCEFWSYSSEGCAIRLLIDRPNALVIDIAEGSFSPRKKAERNVSLLLLGLGAKRTSEPKQNLNPVIGAGPSEGRPDQA